MRGKEPNMRPTFSFVFAAFGVLASTSATIHAGEGFKELTFTLRTSTIRVLPLEPLPIEYTIANNTDHVIVSHVYLRIPDGFIRICVGRQGEAAQRIEPSGPWPYVSYYGPRERELMPGFVSRQEGYFYTDLGSGYEQKAAKHLFPEAGTYRLWAELESEDRKETVASNVLEIAVVRPEGDDAGAYEYLKALSITKYGDLLLRQFWTSTPQRTAEYLEIAEHILDRFPKSRYSAYLRKNTAEAYLRGFGDRQASALALLEKAAREGPELIAPNAWQSLIQGTIESGDLTAAKKQIETYKERYPDRRNSATALNRRLETAEKVLKPPGEHAIRQP
jgi:hypothetical protein